MRKFLFIILLASNICYSTIPHNLGSNRQIKVGLIGQPPFIISYQHYYTGLIIDIWMAIAQLNSLPYKLINSGLSWDQSILDLINNKYDILLGNYSYTFKREKLINFTHPFLLTSTSILTLQKKDTVSIISTDFILRYLYLFISIILTFFICSFLYAKLELKQKYIQTKDKKTEKSKYYAMYITSTALLKGSFASPPTTLQGRILALIIILAGLIFIGLITAGFTSSAILLEKPIIKFPTYKSLQGKTFLLWGESSHEKKLVSHYKANFKTIPTNKNIYNIYINNIDKYSGIIAELPVLHYIKDQSKNKSLKISSLILNQEILGFITKQNSPYLEILNKSILTLQEDGELDKICQHYLHDDCIGRKNKSQYKIWWAH